MSYCVHCGVELAPSEESCPLCKTPVLDPNQPWSEPEERPYPERLEVVPTKIDHRYGAKLASLFLLIPMAAVLFSDLILDQHMTWSAYVLGACGCAFCWVILPFWLNVERPYLYIALNTLSSALYLALVAWMSGGFAWFPALALPLTMLAGCSAMISVYVCRRSRMPALDKVSIVFLIAAAVLAGLESLIDLWIDGEVRLVWSLYALLPLAALSAVFRIIERRPKLKENILKRLFL
ncbi:MAG: hypothetical protein GX647_01290 [Clostridiales bacterium]|nr:hypothetical protein [Clostridiales bacterium]OPZ68203.1 MAG: hypothetical protein BWY81_00950 [Firmicutes bacterium ADurb.Bin467]